MSASTAVRLASAHVDVHAFAREVRHYLTQTPRQLPSRYLYDPLGSALFDAICRLPWYPVTRAELRLIAAHRQEILRIAGAPSIVAELGSGSGEKLSLLLASTPGRRSVHLVDVSAAALDTASRALAELPGTTVVPHQDQYEEGLLSIAAARTTRDPLLLLFLGSNLGNFDRDGSQDFLRAVRASLRPGDYFLIGVDLVKPERDLQLAYDDPLGVTAAFNKNLLVRLNHELDATFDLDAFAHRGIWNAVESRVEMHLEAVKPTTARVARAGLTIDFAPGERIWTESSYKYEAQTFRADLQAAGFRPSGQWIDTEGRFLLFLGRAA
jgi:dimethylhistidine N-methyltransferase